MKTTLKLGLPAMVDFVKSCNGSSTFVSMETVTQPKLKKSCPFNGVTKTSSVTGWINIDYKAAVERKVAAVMGVPVAEVDYTPGDVWHKPVMDDSGKMTPLRVNKTKDDGKVYLFYFHRKTTEAVYRDASGKILNYSDLKPHFYATSQSEFKPAVRSVTLNNVTKLKARGFVVKSK